MDKLKFMAGLDLNRRYFKEVVEPILQEHFKTLEYSAGLAGYGSDALGTDTEISMDHEWGPRLVVFVKEEDLYLAKDIDQCLKRTLPNNFLGFPTNFSYTDNEGIRRMEALEDGLVNHHIEVTSFDKFLDYTLGRINYPVKALDYLYFNDQSLIEVTNGELYRDDLSLDIQRKAFKYFSKDIVRLKLAALWNLISSEEAFIGRHFDLADVIGGKIIALRHINYLMKICFCIEGRLIPYSKWLSTLFWRLSISKKLKPHIETILKSTDGDVVCHNLIRVYQIVLDHQNQKDYSKKVDLAVKDYYGRPYPVIFTEEIVKELVNCIEDKALKDVELNILSLVLGNDGLDITDDKKFAKGMLS